MGLTQPTVGGASCPALNCATAIGITQLVHKSPATPHVFSLLSEGLGIWGSKNKKSRAAFRICVSPNWNYRKLLHNHPTMSVPSITLRWHLLAQAVHQYGLPTSQRNLFRCRPSSVHRSGPAYICLHSSEFSQIDPSD